MSKLDKDAVIAKFTEAYKAAHGKEPKIEASGGWYSVDGGKNIRLAALDEMAEVLSGAEVDTAAASEKPAKEAKADTKPKAKKPAKSSSKKAKSSGGFSVKEFWAEQIKSNDPSARQPR